MKALCRRFAGSTRPLTELRSKLSVKEFVQLLNHFPDLQTSGSDGKSSSEILICFADNDDSSSSEDAAQSSEICNFTDDSEFKFHASTSSSNDADSESSSHCDVGRQDKSKFRKALETFLCGFGFMASALLAFAFERSKLK